MSLINDYKNKSSQFIQITEQPKIMTLLSHQDATNIYGETIRYKVRLEDGTETTFDSKSQRLFFKLLALPHEGINQKIELSRTGTGFDTDYNISLMEPF